MQNAIAQDYRPQTLPKILLVEDFDDTRLMMRMWLEKRGYRVVEAETGEDAITLAQQEAPDLIIMDVMMLGMNGIDATQQIRQFQFVLRTTIVVVSAYCVGECLLVAIVVGCVWYILVLFLRSCLS